MAKVQSAIVTGALSIALAGCASTGAVPQPFPRSGRASSEASAMRLPAEGGESIAETALAYRGVPYRLGGSDPSGFDCSGFVWFVLQQHGIALPRTVEEQLRAGRSIRSRQVAAGDLVFFRTAGRRPNHVGVVISNAEFIHAPTSRGEVRVESLESEYWARRFVAVRRVW